MITDAEIARLSRELLHEHGAGAFAEAIKRADLMLDYGDEEGRLIWVRIVDEIRNANSSVAAPPGLEAATPRLDRARRASEG